MTTQIRIGNDLKLIWQLLNDGEPYEPNDTAEVRLLDVHGRPVPIETTIKGNTVEIIYRGRQQYTFGKYSLILVENDGLNDMMTCDYMGAFELVKHSPFPQPNKGDNLIFEVPQITSYVDKSYNMPIATETSLGAVMPVTKTAEMTQAVGVDTDGRLFTTETQTDLTGAIVAVNDLTEITEPTENQTVFVKDKLLELVYHDPKTIDDLYINVDIDNTTDFGGKSYSCLVNGYTIFLLRDELYMQDSFNERRHFFNLTTQKLTPSINWLNDIFYFDKVEYDGKTILRMCGDKKLSCSIGTVKNTYFTYKNDTGIFKFINGKWVKQNDVNLTGYLRLIPQEYVTQKRLDESGFARTSDIELAGYTTLEEVQQQGYTTIDEVKQQNYTTLDIVKQQNYTNKVELTQEEYNNLPVKDTNTIYVITDSENLVIPTKVSELENDTNYLSEIPAEYITETELTQKGYLTEVPAETTQRIDALEQELVGASTTINEINTIIK